MRVNIFLTVLVFASTCLATDDTLEMIVEIENRELAFVGAKLGLRADPQDAFRQAEYELARNEYRTAVKSTLRELDRSERKYSEAKSRLEAERAVQDHVFDMYGARIKDIMESLTMLCINLQPPRDATEAALDVKQEIWTPMIEAGMDLSVPREQARQQFFSQASAKLREMSLGIRVNKESVKRSIMNALKAVRKQIRDQYVPVDFESKLKDLSTKLRIIKIRRQRVERHLNSELSK